MYELTCIWYNYEKRGFETIFADSFENNGDTHTFYVWGMPVHVVTADIASITEYQDGQIVNRYNPNDI